MGQKLRIVFRGEIIAGEVESLVRQRAAQLLKASPEQIEKIFSGAPIVLRKDLPEEEGPRYQRRLEEAGMRVYIEKLKDAPSSPPSPPPPSKVSPAGNPPPGISGAAPSKPPSPFDPFSFSAAPDEAAPASPASHSPDPFSNIPDDAAQASVPVRGAVYKTRTSLLAPVPEPAVAPQEPAPAEEAFPEEMECPKCGTKQPRRTLCWECGADMPRMYREREAEEARLVAEKGLLAERGAALAVLHGPAEHVKKKDPQDIDDEGKARRGECGKEEGNPYRAPAAELESSSVKNNEIAGLMDYLSFGPSGCMKRMTYLTAQFFLTSIYLFMAGIVVRKTASFLANLKGNALLEFLESGGYASHTPSGFWILILPLAVYGVRISMQRCRDIGWSPWLAFLLFVPYVNGIFGLCLAFWPSGGYEAPAGRTNVLLVSIGLALLSGIWFSSGTYKMLKVGTERAGLAQQQAQQDRNGRF